LGSGQQPANTKTKAQYQVLPDQQPSLILRYLFPAGYTVSVEKTLVLATALILTLLSTHQPTCLIALKVSIYCMK
jgi:hypothetical protein